MRSFENEQRPGEVGWLADRRQRLQRMEREAAAQRGHRAAGVEDDGVRLRDRRRDLFDGAVADRDEEHVAARRQLVDRLRGDRVRASRGDAGDRPPDATPRRGERPRRAAAADDSEFHRSSVCLRLANRGAVARRRPQSPITWVQPGSSRALPLRRR